MIALVLIHNHRFDRNLPLLDAMYQSRFDRVWHLMPFYDGDRENVIPVYENSFQFQGYVAQGRRFLEEPGITHYFFAADDLPTARIMAVDEIANLAPTRWQGGAMWSRSEVERLGQTYNWDLDHLQANYPADTLYLHPIKLSQWQRQEGK